MVQRCIRCKKTIVNYSLYCPKCEQDIKEKQDKQKEYKKKIEDADFFEKQKIDY